MDVFAAYATDEKKELEGVWSDIGDGAQLLVARAGNRKYARLLGSQIEKHQRALDTKNDAADELSDKILAEVMAQTVLLGWKNIKFKGSELSYSVDNAKMLLAVKDFRSLVSRLSNDFDSYRVAQEEAQVKT